MHLSTTLDTVARDIGFAWRALRSAPGFTAVAVTVLALGIGANTAIFSVVSAVLLRPLPFPEPERVVFAWANLSAVGGPDRLEVAPADYVSWRARSRSFTGMAAFTMENYNLTGAARPEKITGVRATGNFFTVLGMPPILGRPLTPADEQPEAPAVAVLDERVWRASFAADPGVVGRTIHLNGIPRTVVGVVPADFRFPSTAVSLWVPAKFTPVELEVRSSYYMYVLARLKPGVTLAQAQADMSGVANQVARESPGARGRTAVTVAGLHEHLTRTARPSMVLLFAAVAVVLLIAGANLANLLLTRGSARTKEVAVRQALGATHHRVARQLFTENAVLAVIGATAGVALALPTLRYLARLMPLGLPDGAAPTLDVRVLLFTVVVTTLLVLVFGMGPAYAGARVDLDTAMRAGGGRGTTGRSRLRGALVVAELTLTVVLLVAAGLLLRSYANVLAVDPGFEPRNLLVVETALPPGRYGDGQRRKAFHRLVVERLEAIPGVTAAGFANFPPLTFKGGRAFISAEGQPPPPPGAGQRHMAINRVSGPGYFRALGTPVLSGRDFDARDATSRLPVAIVNKAMAERRWPNRDAVGRRIKFGPPNAPGPWLTVIGVVGNIREMGLDARAEPEVFVASNQGDAVAPFLWPQHLLVRTSSDPLAFAAAVRQAVWSVDPEQAAANMRTMDAIVDAELQSRNTQLTLVAAFAVLAFVMAAIGLYGVLSYTVAQRLPEIGLRVALGAARATVVADTLRGALGLAAVGIVLGLAAAAGVARVLRVWLFDVAPLDPSTFALAAALLGVMALLASVIPAARGASVDPVRVLRAE